VQIKNPAFFGSAVKPEQYPPGFKPEIAFVGRSNVGKSSLLNTLVGKKGLAKVGATPGKTQVINFFDIDGAFYLVDLPGYGYAKVSKEQRAQWADIIETYLKGREQLKAIVLLVDARHEPTKDDVAMCDWIRNSGLAVIVAATKVDKLKKSEIGPNTVVIRSALTLEETEAVILFSSTTGTGRGELLNAIDRAIGR
jgi:GTP-binding protein